MISRAIGRGRRRNRGIKFQILQLIASTDHTAGATAEGQGPGAEDLIQGQGQGGENTGTTPRHWRGIGPTLRTRIEKAGLAGFRTLL